MESNTIDYIDILNQYNKTGEREFVYGEYPEYIKNAMKESLTVFLIKHDITDTKEISRLSELIDDTTFNIQIALIENKKKELKNEK